MLHSGSHQRHFCRDVVVTLTAILCVLICVFWQIPAGECSDSDSPLKLSCNAKRTEISFPLVKDITGRVASLRDPTSYTPNDLLFVRLKWRRHKLTVVLYPNELTTPQTHSEWDEGNETFAHFPESSCFYHGYIRGQESSYVALSTCDGLSGYIQTDEELLFIQPATVTATGRERAHVVYTCEPKQRVAEPKWEPTATGQDMGSGRHRRAVSTPKYLEVMVVADHTLVHALGSKERTEVYVMALMNIANTVYQHHSLGVDIRVVVVKVVFLEKSQQRNVLKKMDAFNTVNMFCEWSRRQPQAYDISVLITKEELGPSGYAPITGLCNPARSCAAVRDEGFSTGFVIAHEMAHVFGLFHDGHGNNCHGRRYQTSMMAALVESKLNHFWWSECSKRRMQEMIRYLFCLNNKPALPEGHYSLGAQSDIDSKLGRPWSLDFQCRMEFGSYFKLCAAFYNDPCGILWCGNGRSNMCRTKRGPPLTGSACGHERECRDEACQYVGSMQPVNGHWGAWSAWTDCSTECGIGIRQRARVCDNPEPAYDGKDCEGESMTWDTCKNDTCESYEDVRDGECGVWDGLQIRYGTHDWQPFEGQNESSLCLQTCKSFYTQEVVTIDVQVSDGAPCSYTGNNSNICVDGKCLTVGCDGKINSTKKEDMCGICGGDGSQCKIVEGVFTLKPTSGDQYMEVVTLPAGARNINIEETRQTAQFLALKDPRYGTIVLNGEKRQFADRKSVITGAMFEYKRTSYSGNESISSGGPIRSDLLVMVYPNRVMDPTAIHFSYTVHKSDFTLEKSKYKWKFEKWSACSATCGQGIQKIIHGCFDKSTGEKVDKELCAFIEQPRQDEVQCTREPCGIVRYNYAMGTDYGECDAKCGESGVQVQDFHCERNFINNNTFDKVAKHFCSHIEEPRITRACKGEPCKKTERFQWTASDEWTECPCGRNGTQTREAMCERVTGTEGSDEETVERVSNGMCDDLVNKPETERSCTGEPCPPRFRWTASDTWRECTCGDEGTQRRDVFCERVTGGGETGTEEQTEIVADSMCDDVPEKPEMSRSCKGKPCQFGYQWTASDFWTECTCGEDGTQRRDVFCERVSNGKSSGQEEFVEVVSDYMCDDLPEKPTSSRSCKGEPCGPRFSWIESGLFTACNAACGEEGTKEPLFECEQVTVTDGSHFYELADDYFCENIPKPEIAPEVCVGEPCEDEAVPYEWEPTDDWTSCDAECDQKATQTRLYRCRQTTQDKSYVSDDYCDVTAREDETRECEGPPCQLKWSFGEWSECSVTCGEGKHYRTVYCGDPDTDVDDIKCTDSPPATSKKCMKKACPQPRDEDCRDTYGYCAAYRSLFYRCKRDYFKRICCRTCMDIARSAKRRRY